MKTLFFKILSFVVIATVLSSCMTTHSYIGNYKQLTNDGETDVCKYSKVRQHYVLGGLVELERRQPEIPPTKNCDVKTQITALDALVNSFTFGIFEQKTIKVYGVASECNMPEKVKEEDEDDEPEPIIDSGLQLEAEMMTAFLVSYKLDPHWSFGLGYGMGSFRSYDEGSVVFPDGIFHRFFINGQYRFSDGKVSPTVRVKSGMQFLDGKDRLLHYKYGLKDLYNRTSFFIMPTVGVSVRLGGNTYLSFNGGYNLAGKLSPKEETVDGYELPKIKVSNAICFINCTHTFRFGQGLHEKARKLINRESN